MRQTSKKQIMIDRIFAVGVMALLTIIILCVMGTLKVMAADRGQSVPNASYLTWKEAYGNRVREYLAGAGYGNSGVAITRIREGSRCLYRVSVHHDRLEGLDATGLAILEADIEGMGADRKPDEVVCVFR